MNPITSFSKHPVPETTVDLGAVATIGEWAEYLHEHNKGFQCGDEDCPINTGKRKPDWRILGMIVGGIL